MAQGLPPEERQLDLLLLRQHRRRVYQGGYIRFANLIYRGEYLAGYAGEEVVLRYDPGDITTVFVYRHQGARDIFLARAHAQNLATERLSLAEAKSISRRLREARSEISNQAILTEIRTRVQFIDDLLSAPSKMSQPVAAVIVEDSLPVVETAVGETEDRALLAPKPLPVIRVYDYEQLRHEHGL
jgi:putative transposase